MLCRLVLLLALGALTCSTAAAQTDPKDETAESVDGVKINCRFYTATKEGNGSVVILCSELNADPKLGDWDGLARSLAEKGFHVIRFDWRGTGGSKDVIADKFWRDNRNQTKVNGYNQTNPRSTIDIKEFQQGYYYSLINDLHAVRHALDLKNDDKKLNTRSIYIVAAGNACPLVQLFLATEWSRPAVKPAPVGLIGTTNELITAMTRPRNSGDVAGHDYAGVCYLSPSRSYPYYSGKNLSKGRVDDQSLRDWVSQFSRDNLSGGELRKATAFKFIYGDKDSTGMTENTFYATNLLNIAGKAAPKVEPMKNSDTFVIKGAKETGAELLGKDNAYKTETKIFEWMDKVEADRKKLNPIDRKYDKPMRINWGSFRVNN